MEKIYSIAVGKVLNTVDKIKAKSPKEAKKFWLEKMLEENPNFNRDIRIATYLIKGK